MSHLNGSSFHHAGRILSKVSLGRASPSAKLARMLSSSSVSSGSASPSIPSSPSPSPSPPFGAFSVSGEKVHKTFRYQDEKKVPNRERGLAQDNGKCDSAELLNFRGKIIACFDYEPVPSSPSGAVTACSPDSSSSSSYSGPILFLVLAMMSSCRRSLNEI